MLGEGMSRVVPEQAQLMAKLGLLKILVVFWAWTANLETFNFISRRSKSGTFSVD
jgi:hypothetical protein